jgi:hypothetical protein
VSPEFPSDNPELWLVRSPHRTPFAAALESELDLEVVDFEDADFEVVESIEPPTAPRVALDPFQGFLRTLVNVSLGAGAPARLAAALPGMVGAARLEVQALDASTVDMLVAAGLLARESGTVTRCESFVANAQAWRATMLGEATELSVSSMLDEWSAHIVATLAGTPERKEALRRELRGHGIAAFGLIAEAA